MHFSQYQEFYQAFHHISCDCRPGNEAMIYYKAMSYYALHSFVAFVTFCPIRRSSTRTMNVLTLIKYMIRFIVT